MSANENQCPFNRERSLNLNKFVKDSIEIITNWVKSIIIQQRARKGTRKERGIQAEEIRVTGKSIYHIFKGAYYND